MSAARTVVDVYYRKRHQCKRLNYYGETLIARFSCLSKAESWRRAHMLVQSKPDPSKHFIRETRFEPHAPL